MKKSKSKDGDPKAPFSIATTPRCWRGHDSIPWIARGGPRRVMVKAMDCRIVVSKFVLQSRYYVHFRAITLGKGMNPFILPAIGQIVPLLFFYENGFGIK